MKRSLAAAVAIASLSACASAPQAVPAPREPASTAETTAVSCVLYERNDGSWELVGGFAPPLDGAAGSNDDRYSLRAIWTSKADDRSVFLVKIRDKTGDPRTVTEHRYRLDLNEPATNPFKPDGFTGRVSSFLESGLGLRYSCIRR